ncbi:MAG TPA: GspMb/PilO family protein [Bacteroidia bacterium]|nr:GspMb/PilO family protein [Bacteroidia bacterium]
MNASPHRQAILVFGIVAPMFLIGALAVAVFMGHSKLQQTHRTKIATLERYHNTKRQADELEAFLALDDRREKTAYWNSKLEQDLIESLTHNLDKILAKYDTNVLQQTEMGQATGAGTIGSKTKLPHARMKLSFEGGLKPMQLLLAELETEMPQLVLEEISVAPQPGASGDQTGKLAFTVVYHCWEKTKSTPVQ